MFKSIKRLIFVFVVLFSILMPIPASAAPAPQGTGGGDWYYGYHLIPVFFVDSVARDVSVTVTTYNFPAGDSFVVLMNVMGTHGMYGIPVATVNSGSGGTLTFTFNIPPALFGLQQIAIRMQSNTGSGYFAYNWFYNNTAFVSSGGRGNPPPPIPIGYWYYPTFWISGVLRDSSVTIVTNNLPANDIFQVLMGPMGSLGINGFPVTTFNTGAGGAQTLTFNVPPPMYGAPQIAIRLQSISGSGFFAYNWFYNNSTY